MEQPEETMTEDQVAVAVEDKPDREGFVDEAAGNIVRYVEERFTRAETAKYSDEQRALRAYRNYRGRYGPDVQFREDEKSRIFVKVTKTKVVAAYQQIVDVLFGNDKFPLSIQPTKLPDGIEEAVHFKTPQQQQPQQPGMPPQPQQEMPELPPGTTTQKMLELGGLSDKLKPVSDKLVKGEGTTPDTVTFHPATVAAAKMEKKIHDQLEEASANKKLRNAIFELCLFGTGIIKGPFAVDKEYPQWGENGSYEPLVKLVPSISHVSFWNFYPDPDADNMEECEFTIERHKLSRSQLRALKKRPFFRSNAINTAVGMGENYVEKWWEHQLDDEQTHTNVERFEALEYWGNVSVEDLVEHNVEIPDEVKDLEEVSANIWICNGQLLRLVVNPFKPTILPYHSAPYEINPYSFFGVGVAENMDDTQTMMNGFMRMAIDNAALAGNVVFEVDEDNLVPGQDLVMYPGKVIRRAGGAPGQALFATKYPSTANENMQMFDKARQLSDESTGLPSFSHGQTGITGVGRTSSGISMLMSAASGAIRSVVKNIDDYLLAPLGKSLYHFNMQFDYEDELTGDLEVKARGTESLMANEVRSQRLMQFLSVVQNPVLAPFAKMDYIIREIAKSLDLDPEKVVNSLGDAAIQAEIMRQMAPEPTPTPGPQPEGGPGVPAPTDQQGSGNGNIGVGQATTPPEQGFAGNIPQGMPV